MNLSYKFRPGKTRVRPTATKRPYNVRWTVEGKRHDQYFRTAALAESFRAELTRAAARGEAFDIDTGLPISKLRELESKARAITWMTHAQEYAAEKWPRLSGKGRVSVAEVLVTVSLTLLPAKGRDRPADAILRAALRRWAFNGQEREETVPEDVQTALSWADKNSPPLTVLGDMGTLRAVLNECARKMDGKPAAANYLARRRQVLHNVLKYAVIWKRLDSNPLNDPDLHWERPSDLDTDHEVDPRVIGTPRQVEQMLAAVTYVGLDQATASWPSLPACSTGCFALKRSSGCVTKTTSYRKRDGAGSFSRRPSRRPARHGRTAVTFTMTAGSSTDHVRRSAPYRSHRSWSGSSAGTWTNSEPTRMGGSSAASTATRSAQVPIAGYGARPGRSAFHLRSMPRSCSSARTTCVTRG